MDVHRAMKGFDEEIDAAHMVKMAMGQEHRIDAGVLAFDRFAEGTGDNAGIDDDDFFAFISDQIGIGGKLAVNDGSDIHKVRLRKNKGEPLFLFFVDSLFIATGAEFLDLHPVWMSTSILGADVVFFTAHRAF